MIRRLFFDVEVSYCKGWFWRPSHKTSISYHQILEHGKIICISYKWEGQDKVYNLNWNSTQCDKDMLNKFIKILNQADEIVGHNSDRFDIKWLRTRCIYHKLPMFPTYKSFDTLKFFRGNVLAPSNRLDYLGEYYNEGRKLKNEDDLWYNVIEKNNRSALKRMVKYCDQDVLLLERIYKRIKPYSKAISHVSGVKSDCPECGSDEVKLNGHSYTAGGTKKQRLVCLCCGKSYHYTEPRKKII